MKTLLAAAAAILTIATATPKAPATPPETSGLLTRTAIITDLDYDADRVTLVDSVGYILHFDGCEDWTEGDVVSLLMWDNGTPAILDDVILQTTYTGYTSADIH